MYATTAMEWNAPNVPSSSGGYMTSRQSHESKSNKITSNSNLNNSSNSSNDYNSTMILQGTWPIQYVVFPRLCR